MRKAITLWIVAGLFLLVVIGGYWVWQQRVPAQVAPPPVQMSAPSDVKPLPPPEPAIRYPVQGEADSEFGALPNAGKIDAHVSAALTRLLGQKAVLEMLQTDDFARRFVATIDNLTREHAAQRLWPVNPTSGRFAVTGFGEAQTVSQDNSLRYAPFVRLVGSIDATRGVALYAHLYPLFQRAYEELGYPGRYFNDRVVAVIDHLLAAPEPDGPLKVRITEVKGPIKSARPWLHYEFADPALQSLSSGQKLLLRLGPENERRIKAKLREIRGLLTRHAVSR